MNPLGLKGIRFVEFSAVTPQPLRTLFEEFGFTLTHVHSDREIEVYEQNSILFLLNSDPNSFGYSFAQLHGPSICSMGWDFEDSASAQAHALRLGATTPKRQDYLAPAGRAVPAISGIGGSLIYFLEPTPTLLTSMGFKKVAQPKQVAEKGFLRIDHLTHNVVKGTMGDWAAFYKNIFGFTEIRYFDIKGQKTGLQSFALKSSCGTFCIPINEANEKTSQINEYLDRYHGPGIQHIAFSTNDILASLDKLRGTSIKTLDILETYYDTVFTRVPNVTEDHARIKTLKVLVDGDEKGYLLQIFTKDVVGPIFIEIIQRKNHHSFGEGNFQALFDSIERDQQRRGVL